MSEFIVAIDGPAGSGKSSVSKAAARRLDFSYLDTGAAYRALAWYVADAQIDSADPAAVIAALPGFDYRIGVDPDAYFVAVGDTDVTDAIREPAVSAGVSAIARIPEVRVAINDIFHRIIRDAPTAGIIVEGRDITTVVAPDAPVRILLTAAEEIRAARRSGELTGAAAAGAAQALHNRDRADSAVVDFLTAAEGVHTLDSSDLTYEETIQAVIDLISLAR